MPHFYNSPGRNSPLFEPEFAIFYIKICKILQFNRSKFQPELTFHLTLSCRQPESWPCSFCEDNGNQRYFLMTEICRFAIRLLMAHSSSESRACVHSSRPIFPLKIWREWGCDCMDEEVLRNCNKFLTEFGLKSFVIECFE